MRVSCGLLRDRLVGEHPDPDLAAALDVAGHRDPRRLDLPVRHPARLHRLQTVIAERQSEPRHALPRMRPCCCFRYLTFFGINMMNYPLTSASGFSSQLTVRACRTSSGLPSSCRRPRALASLCARATARRPVIFLAADLRHQALALVEPHLDADDAVGRVRLGEAVVDVGAQRLQRQLPVQVPLERAISAPFSRPETRTLMPCAPNAAPPRPPCASRGGTPRASRAASRPTRR